MKFLVLLVNKGYALEHKKVAIVERELLGFTTLLPSLDTDQYFFIIVETEKDATTVP